MQLPALAGAQHLATSNHSQQLIPDALPLSLPPAHPSLPAPFMSTHTWEALHTFQHSHSTTSSTLMQSQGNRTWVLKHSSLSTYYGQCGHTPTCKMARKDTPFLLTGQQGIPAENTFLFNCRGQLSLILAASMRNTSHTWWSTGCALCPQHTWAWWLFLRNLMPCCVLGLFRLCKIFFDQHV